MNPRSAASQTSALIARLDRELDSQNRQLAATIADTESDGRPFDGIVTTPRAGTVPLVRRASYRPAFIVRA